MKKLLSTLLASLCLTAQADNVTFTWDLSINSAGYKLYQASGSSGPFNVVATPSAPPVTVTVTANSWFYVTAFNSGGESGPSNTVNYTPTPTGPNLVFSMPVLDKPTLQQGQTLSITATIRNTGNGDYSVTDGSLVLLQPGATRADGPYKYATPAVVPQVIRAGATLSYYGTWTSDSTSPLGNWSVYLVVTDGSGVWTASPFASLTVTAPQQQPPPPPVNFRVTGSTTSRIDLQWDAIASGESVVIDWSDVSMVFKTASTVNYPGVKYSKTGLKRNRLYYFRARRKNTNGFSDYTPTLAARTSR